MKQLIRLVLISLFFAVTCLSWAQAATENDIAALTAAKNGAFSRASTLAGHSKDPLVHQLVTWLYITDDDRTPSAFEMMRFAEKYPHWPYMSVIKRKIEQELGVKQSLGDGSRLRSWFKSFPAITDDGKFLEVYSLNLGSAPEQAKARELVKKYWEEGVFNIDQQKRILATFPKLLSADNHKKRLDTLIWEGNYDRAEAALQYVSKDFAKVSMARIRMARMDSGVDTALSSLPPSMLNEAGLIYERIRWRRQKDLTDEAASLLNAIKSKKLPYPEKWWNERNILARRYFEDGQYKKAYALAANHEALEGHPYAQAEWLAGWIAMDYLAQPGKAFGHFKNLFDNTVTPISKARGAYWAGLASERKNYPDIAKQWYQVAAQYYETFYGQMAGDKLAKNDAILRTRLSKIFDPAINASLKSAFDKREFVRATRLLHAAGLDDKINPFMINLAKIAKTPEDYALLAGLSKEIGHYESLLKIGKQGYTEKRFNMWDAAFPKMPVNMSDNPSKALTYGVIRQESAFNPYAKSPAGALGLMQLMPATAKEVAKRNRMTFISARLKTSKDYNVKLGQSYLEEMIYRFDGAEPMAIAAYNAGPSRVDAWIKKFGDPRKNEISWIDWMESIPIYETRNYVQRVMEAQRVYRYR